MPRGAQGQGKFLRGGHRHARWHTPDQIPPPRPPVAAKSTTSVCEPYRTFIEAQLRFKRKYTAIYQDLVDQHGFTGAYNSVKRFCGGLCKHELEQFDRLKFAPGAEAWSWPH